MDGRGPQNKLRHVCRAIKYMSGKSRRRYRLVRGAGVGRVENSGMGREGVETEWGEIHETSLHRRRDGGPSGLSSVCCSPLFEGGKHSFREGGKVEHGRTHGRVHRRV